MKTLILFFMILASAVSILPQTKSVRTGLYLVMPQDSCAGQKHANNIVYLSDTLCLEQNPVIAVKDIETCATRTSKLDGKDFYVLNIKLKKSAALKFKVVTGKNVGKRMALVIAGKVVMAAVVRDPITSGMLTVSGESKQELNVLYKKLKQEMKK